MSDFKVLKFSRFSRSILQHRYVTILFLECKMSLFFIPLLRNVEMHVDNYRPTQIIAISTPIFSYT